jgi:UBA/TS-N domain
LKTLQVPAPPSASAALPGASSTAGTSTPPLTFDYEKQVLRELEAPRNLDATISVSVILGTIFLSARLFFAPNNKFIAYSTKSFLNLTEMQGNNNLRKDERCEALISQCCSSGFTREESILALAVALAIAGPRADGATVARAAGSIRQMTGMGYQKQDAVGALVAKNGNLQAAVEMF